MDVSNVIFQGWEPVIHTLVVGVLGYITLVCFLRISGKRTLAKLNAFDLVVTVSLGSTLSAMLLQPSVSLIQGMTALALLILLQFIVTFFSVRSPSLARAVRSEPTLLARDGALCREAMRRERITEEEIMSALRGDGQRYLADLALVFLESDGTISVVPAK